MIDFTTPLTRHIEAANISERNRKLAWDICESVGLRHAKCDSELTPQMGLLLTGTGFVFEFYPQTTNQKAK